jgi:ankyrin repeat protein
LERGADPDGSDYSGGTALQEALFRHRLDLAEILIGAGAAVDPPRWGMLAKAVDYSSQDIGMYVYQAEKQGGSPDAAVLAEKQGAWRRILTRLVEAGADLERPDDRGRTPLFAAVNAGDPVVLRTLIELGADLSHRVDGGSVLHFLAGLGRLEEPNLVAMVPAFAGTRAEFAARDGEGRTPAEVAGARGRARLAEALSAGSAGAP